jgi:hypothetical protein
MILTGENRIMEHWWNDTDRGKQKYWEKNLFQCLLVHHKYHMYCPGIKPGPHLLHKDQTVGADVRIVQNMFCVHI